MRPEDIDLFESLNKTPLGGRLADYLKRLQDRICDSRNWKDGDTKESVNKAANYIQSDIINKLKRSVENNEKQIMSEYES